MNRPEHCEKADIYLFESSASLLPTPIPRNRLAVGEDDVAALVDGAGFQFGAGAADGEGGGAAAAIAGRRFANRSTISEAASGNNQLLQAATTYAASALGTPTLTLPVILAALAVLLGWGEK